MPDVNGVDVAVGAAVRRLRKAAGIEPGALAAAAGQDTQALSAAEAGDRRLQASELFALSSALGAPFSHFFESVETFGARTPRLVREDGEDRLSVELQRP